MNKYQLHKVARLDYDALSDIIIRLATESNRPELIKLDFSEIECIDIVRSVRRSVKPTRFVLEEAEIAIHEWFAREEREGYYIYGTADFVEAFEKEKPKCCNTCAYISAKSKDTVKRYMKPYCSLYKKYITLGNVYKDRCNCYLFDNDDKPKKWTRKGAPTNLNIYGEIDNRILGIENFNFTDKKTEEINLLWQLEKN